MLTPDEGQIRERANDYARKNKKEICKRLTDPAFYPPEENPVSVFMAGSPGAGKTEASMELIAVLEARATGVRILRIDPDELRAQFPDYRDGNAYLFQGAVSILVDRILDVAFKQGQSFLLDGTRSDRALARANVGRCLRRNRLVQILYVWQDPMLAWQFVKAREAEEGRNISLDAFVHQYFAARDVVNALKAEFGAQIKVDVLIKPHDSTQRVYRDNVERIDPEKYTPGDLMRLLGGCIGA